MNYIFWPVGGSNKPQLDPYSDEKRRRRRTITPILWEQLATTSNSLYILKEKIGCRHGSCSGIMLDGELGE